MIYHNRKIFAFLLIVWLFTAWACAPRLFLSNNNGNENENGGNGSPPTVAVPPTPDPGATGGQSVDAESNRDGVFIIDANGQRRPLDAPNRATLRAGEGIDVSEAGRAILRFADLFSIEVLRSGELILKELAVDERSAIVTVIQNGGSLLNSFDPDAEISRRFTIETDFAVITATGTRFIVAREDNSPLEWIIALDAGSDSLEVTAAGETRLLIGGEARWVAPIGEPGSAFTADMANVQRWLNALQNGQIVREIGDVVWAPADELANTSDLSTLPDVGGTLTLNESPVVITMDPPTAPGGGYWLADCNGDGNNNIMMRNGRLQLDFRPVVGRVNALDVTLINLDEPGSGQVRVLDPARHEIVNKPLTAAANQGEIFDFRHGVPYHYAEISMAYGCFLGFSLTPPDAYGLPSPPRPAVEQWQESNVGEWMRPSENGELFASRVHVERSPIEIEIDGVGNEWAFLGRLSGVGWTPINQIVYDNSCARNRSGYLAVAAAVQFAYDHDNLYVAFMVSDWDYNPYSGSDERYFLGDAPQLLLDLDLIGDFHKEGLSDDDIQIDFHPGDAASGYSQVALRRLDALMSRPFDDASSAVAVYEGGYFLEAALPWSALGVQPTPGLRLGVAANVNYKNEPTSYTAQQRQDCILSTAYDLDWRSPNTWGTLTLGD